MELYEFGLSVPVREFGLSAPTLWYSDYMERLHVYVNSRAPAMRILVNCDKFGLVPPPREFRHSAPALLDIRGKCH